MDVAQNKFRDFLHQRQLKYTTERQAILQCAQQLARPFEAEELLLLLRQMNCRASRATVYRTLKHLVAAQLLKPVLFRSSRQCYYDYVGDGAGHDHLLDIESGELLAFCNDDVVELRNRIAKKMGFAAVSHRFEILGRRVESRTLSTRQPPHP